MVFAPRSGAKPTVQWLGPTTPYQPPETRRVGGTSVTGPKTSFSNLLTRPSSLHLSGSEREPVAHVTIDDGRPPEDGFRERTKKAYDALIEADKSALAEALRADDQARQAAALAVVEHKGLKLKPTELVRLLRYSREPEVSLPAARMLQHSQGPEVLDVFRRHLASKAHAADEAAHNMAEHGGPEGQEALLEFAATGGHDAASLAAIRALGSIPGARTEALLAQFDEDMSEAVRKAAAEAHATLARRAADPGAEH